MAMDDPNHKTSLSEILIKLRDFHLSQKNPSLDIKIHSTNHTRIFSLALPLRPSLQETCDNFANLSLLFGGKRFYEEDNVLDDPSLEKGRIALENQDEPTITVITIVRNNSLGLRKTIESVSSQSWHKLEYLVIDGTPTGGKQDENLKLLHQHSSSIDFWLSCLDKGIYDAMNRGALLAKGKFLLFMNAGDQFYSQHSLKEFASFWNPQIDILYGDYCIDYSNKNLSRIHRVNPILSYMDLLYAMVFCHQSLLIRTDLQRKYPYTLDRITSDYGFVLQCFQEGYKFAHAPVIVARVDTAGISNQRRVKVQLERWKFCRKFYPRPWLSLFFLGIVASTALRSYTQKLLGNHLTSIVLRIKYSLLNILTQQKKQMH